MRDPLEIQFWLRKRGKNQRGVAEYCKVSEAYVSQIVNKKRRSARVEKVIARWTGFSRKALFGPVAA